MNNSNHKVRKWRPLQYCWMRIRGTTLRQQHRSRVKWKKYKGRDWRAKHYKSDSRASSSSLALKINCAESLSSIRWKRIAWLRSYVNSSKSWNPQKTSWPAISALVCSSSQYYSTRVATSCAPIAARIRKMVAYVDSVRGKWRHVCHVAKSSRLS